MEREYPHKCKEAIRKGRVKPKDEDFNVPGVNCLGDAAQARTQVIAQYEEKVVSQSGVYVQEACMMLPKKAFIVQTMLHWGETDAEANELWRESMLKNGSGPDTVGSEKVLVPFFKPVERVGSIARTHQHAVAGQNQALSDEEDMKKAWEKMSGRHVENELLNQYSDLGGDHFKGMLDNVTHSSTSHELTSEQLRLTNAPANKPVGVQPENNDQELDVLVAEGEAVEVSVRRSSV